MSATTTAGGQGGSRPGRGLRGTPGPAPRSRWLLVLLGLWVGIPFIVAPLGAEQQAWLAVAGFLVFLIVSRLKGRLAPVILVMLSVLISFRYLYWRLTDTLDVTGFWQTFLGTGLLLAELYAVVALLLSYLQSVWPLQRKPVPMPEDLDAWPTLDVFIPSYNEPLSVVKPSIFGALAMDWPREKLNVMVLDDGRREDFRAFCEEIGCGYMIRPDNKGAKAGNINHALGKTKGEFILIFDCDHVPVRAFAQMTLGWMLRDERIAMLQTPHHFYSPDPFERNLASGLRIPNEGLLFYGLIQPGNDLWNAAFFCGSCAVIRRTALEQVGGVPHQTVTEDCHCSLKMQRLGWHTAFIRLPLAAGLATDRLVSHIGQRMRWGRGMVQIFRVENPLFGPGLSLAQRLCYVSSMWHFLFPVPRFVFLTAPLAFLLFGQNLIAASPLAIVAYAGPHVVHAVATNSRLQGAVRHSFWSEIYETVLSLWLLPVVVTTLLDPRKGKFNVTDKGGVLDEGFFDMRAVGPNAVLAVVQAIGLAVGIWGMLTTTPGTLPFQAYALNTLWIFLSLFVVLAGIAVGRERRQVRERARVGARLPMTVVLPDGQRFEGRTLDLSLGGAALEIPAVPGAEDGELVALEVTIGDERIALPAQVLRWREGRMQVRFAPQNVRDEGNVTRVVLGRADSWVEWDKVRRDRPMRALWEVMVSIRGLFRGDSQISLRRNRAAARNRPPASPPPRLGPPTRSAQRAAAVLLGLGLALSPAMAQAQRGAQRQAPATPPPAAAPATPAPPPVVEPVPAAPAPAEVVVPEAAPAATRVASPTARQVSRTLRQLGLRSPMQLRGLTDLQGVLFGLRADEVATEARLVLQGASSPALIPELSQIAVTLNEQFVGTITPDRARPNFGPVEFPINPAFFAETNRLNFRFTGRYAVECNDPLSGLLWATVSDLSTLHLTVERLPLAPDLSRLPEPFFDSRVVRDTLVLPMVVPDGATDDVLRAAVVASSWFAVQADYRGASFPTSASLPAQGNAVVIAPAGDQAARLNLPRVDGPTLVLVPNPNDAAGLLLVVTGRTGAEIVAAAQALAVSRAGLSGQAVTVSPPQIAARAPYDAPRWIPSDRPVRIGELVDPSELQSFGFAPGNIAVPFRTAPDLYTWRQHALPVQLRYRSPPGPVADLSVSRLDVSVNDIYLKSLPLRAGDPSWPWNWIIRRLGLPEGSDRGEGSAGLPPYLLFGQNELQLRFDMRPLNRGDCTAVPGDIRASVDPDSTINLSRAHRYAVLPNLAFFAGSGFPFSRHADLSQTALVLPDRPNPIELSAALTLVGRLSANLGLPALNITVARPGALPQLANHDLLVVGPLPRLGGVANLLRESPVTLEGNRLTVALPTPMENFRNLFQSSNAARERDRLSATLSNTADGQGMLLATQSPLEPGRSVVILTGTTAEGMEGMLAALRDPAQLPRIQGDLAWFSGGRVDSFQVGRTYSVGELPVWLWPQLYLGDRPDLVLLLLIGGAVLLAIPAYWSLRRRSAARLRARTQ
ncbi:UDP-forming cellulose synthase catalytic subunit [Roseomonas sp. OT10]|uniref:UDP-forming cellulose synthase catalytic subunit n=1 Tax=Roseomonas cutis TaxID=2897332 RepID=UPI001E5093D5|nr:UDP-forming cellulose synthase catalytic subunit [Roseomonas sp. OT10]UFN47305.1 UDP-forming cellulose synthase catalytic subunit [Roseomonas sp. OT10]